MADHDSRSYRRMVMSLVSINVGILVIIGMIIAAAFLRPEVSAVTINGYEYAPYYQVHDFAINVTSFIIGAVMAGLVGGILFTLGMIRLLRK